MIPLVSICIPTYNGKKYIAEALDSVIEQDYRNLEIIISDDQSSDNTVTIIESYKSITKIPIHIFNHTPKGIGSNWNNCIINAKGEYIKFLFQDDCLEPKCVSQMVTMMASADTIGMVYAKRYIISEIHNKEAEGFIKTYGELHTYWGELIVNTGVISGKDYLKDSQFLNAPKNKVGEPSSVLIRKTCFDNVGLFNTSLKQGLDCEFWYRLMPYYNIGFIDKYLGSFRLHDQQASNKNKRARINESEDLYKIYYKTIFPYLHNKCKWKLNKRFHPILRILVSIKRLFFNAK